MYVGLASTARIVIFKSPPGDHHLRLVVVDHSVSEQSWQFQGSLLVEFEHGDVRSHFNTVSPIVVEVCRRGMECLQHARIQDDGGILKTAPRLSV